MGCAGSTPAKGDGNVKKIRKPKPWKHPQPITKSQLVQMREEFWDTAPHYGGRKVRPRTIKMKWLYLDTQIHVGRVKLLMRTKGFIRRFSMDMTVKLNIDI
ncbi:hypothetical protein SCA6_018219 [Theobroma cacao]